MSEKIDKAYLMKMLGQRVEVKRGDHSIRGYIDEAALNQDRNRFLISDQAGTHTEKFKGIWVNFADVTELLPSPEEK